MNVLMTGSNGLIGSALMPFLGGGGHQVRRLLRTESHESDTTSWDPANGTFARGAFEGIDAVVHLAGEGIASGRWTEGRKTSIRDSRVVGTRNLCEALADLDTPPSVLVAASAIGFYGDRGDEVLDESSAPGTDFLAEVCERWEAEAQAAEEFGVRVVNPRIGIVLGRHGGALAKMLLPFKLGMGGRLGNGRQYMSWIHVDDLAALLRFAAQNSPLSGPICAVAPKPVTNAEFTRELAGALHRPAFFPVPGIALKLIVGQFAEVLLGSQRIVPTGAQRVGYSYQFAKLPDALRDLLDQ